MKTASVATIQHDLKSILAQVEHGTTFRITRHGKLVAYLTASPPVVTGRTAKKAGRAEKWRNPAFGSLAGSVIRYGDLVSPLPEEWEARS